MRTATEGLLPPTTLPGIVASVAFETPAVLVRSLARVATSPLDWIPFATMRRLER